MPRPSLSAAHPARTLAPLVLALTLGFGAEAAAQTVPANPGPVASPAPRELALTYNALMAEYQSYRPLATAAGADQAADEGIEELELDGLVLDQTLTRIGREFYDAFVRMWQAPQGAFNYAVTIQEQPVIGFGTGVTVRVNDEVTFQARLTPRGDIIESAAVQATALAARQLQRRASAGRG